MTLKDFRKNFVSAEEKLAQGKTAEATRDKKSKAAHKNITGGNVKSIKAAIKAKEAEIAGMTDEAPKTKAKTGSKTAQNITNLYR